MGRFRAAPRVGHLERLTRICGYLHKKKDGAIRFRTGPPNNIHVEPAAHDWEYSVYGQVAEEIPSNMPAPCGVPVRTTSFVDANLLHDLTTGRSAMGVLHFLMQVPI
jgi:hypothetical protein